jgi:muconolactone delta-isomerase
MSSDSVNGESIETDVGRGKQRLSLPSVPLTDDDLTPLADHADVDAVHVPVGRPASVTTGGGRLAHRGDILTFWIEFGDRYRRATYETGDEDDGLAWYAAPLSVFKSDGIAEGIETTLREEYQPIGGDD